MSTGKIHIAALREYEALLDRLDGKQVRVGVAAGGGNNDVDFDRRVEKTLDRLHRRKRIAEQ